MMCDAFVTVDAGQSGLQSCHHTLLRGWGHLMNIEGALIMAIAALARIRRLHGGPDILSELQPMPFEFFRRVDSAQKLVPELVTGLDFSPNFREPGMGDVTVGAARSHAELILVVNGLLVFLINSIAHLMTGNTELQRIGFFHPPVEATPEYYSADAAKDDQRREREPRAGAPQHRPNTRENSASRTRLVWTAHNIPR